MLDVAAHHRPLAERLARELEEVALVFERQLASDLSAVNTLCLHVERYRGKMLRPTLVLLSALASTGDEDAITPRHRVLAAVVEMIHMATLVHDDVLDEASVRRQGATVNRLWGNERAVMLGDYLISNAFHLCSTLGEPEINLALGAVTNTLCAGELLQLHHRNDWALEEPTYLEIIHRKTASLIAACCHLGARLAGAADATVSALDDAGGALGIAFQIQDDLLDLLGEESVVGKSLGRDLEKGKLTLPVLRLLDRAEARERSVLLGLLDAHDGAALRTRLLESGAVDDARRTARAYVDRAKDALAKLPPGPTRELMLTMADGVVERDS